MRTGPDCEATNASRDVLARVVVLRPPGTAFQHSSYNTQLLGLILKADRPSVPAAGIGCRCAMGRRDARAGPCQRAGRSPTVTAGSRRCVLIVQTQTTTTTAILGPLPGLLLLGLAAYLFLHELALGLYDWDVDHFMYFGTRLAAGAFHWTSEFDDKLPVVQLLFLAPALAGSVAAWQVLSAASVAGACLLSMRFLSRDALHALSPEDRFAWGLFSAGVTACLVALLPGGFAQINAAAASFALIGILLLDAAEEEDAPGRRRLLWLVAAFFGSVAIGIRPYLFLPVALAATWTTLRRTGPAGRKPLLARQILWLATLGLWGAALNAAPYLVIGDPGLFLDGLAALSLDLVPQSPGETLSRMAQILGGRAALLSMIAAILVAALVLGSSGAAAGTDGASGATRRAADIGFFLGAAPLAIGGAIVAKHFWAHYVQLLAPFVGLSAGLVLARLSVAEAQGLAHLGAVARWLVAAAIAAHAGLGPASVGIASGERRQRPEARAEAFRAFLADRPAGQRAFLAPSDMKLHWMLDEPRHGFPHAANVGFVFAGYWEGLDFPARFRLPTTGAAFCEMLEARGPAIVATRAGAPELACLEAGGETTYAAAATVTSGTGRPILVYERIAR